MTPELIEETDLRTMHGTRAMRMELVLKQQLKYGFSKTEVERVLHESEELIAQHYKKYPDK